MVKAAAGLKGAGHRVFVASKKGAEILKAAQAAGVETRVFNIYGDFSPWNTVKVALFLKKEAIDVMVCNLNKDVRVAGLGARLAGKTVVIARHGVQLCAPKWKHKVTLQNLADGIVTNTVTIRKNYAEYGWFDADFVKVIYNGIEDKSRVKAADLKADDPDKKIVFAAGRLSDQKGFSYLIEAAEILCRKRDDLMFLIAGKGRLEAMLNSMIDEKGLNESVRLLGFREDTDSLMKGSDLFCLSSLFEGMPNVVMEAMAVGKAVVATDVNGVRELMTEETGLIVPPRNAKALAGAIGVLIDDPEQCREMGEKGAARVKAAFTIPAMVKNLETYFEAMIARKQAKDG